MPVNKVLKYALSFPDILLLNNIRYCSKTCNFYCFNFKSRFIRKMNLDIFFMS